MNLKTSVLAVVILLFSSFTFAQGFNFSLLPNGLPAPRINSAIGVLSTAYTDSVAATFQKQLQTLENKSYGMFLLGSQPVGDQAEVAYYLEGLAIQLLKDISNSPKLTSFDRSTLSNMAVEIYADIRYHNERLFEIMIREIDKAKPGTSGIQLSSLEGDSVLYSPNYRYEVALTQEQMRKEYDKKLAEFKAKGGSLSEVFTLNAENVRNFSQAVTKIEFVQMPSGEVRATKGNAGHILLAEGQKTRTAGVAIFVKNDRGEIVMLVLSNSSGSYKPDISTMNTLATKLTKDLNIPYSSIVVTKGEPLSTQIVKIMLKADNISDDAIKARINSINKNYAALIADPQSAIEGPVISGGTCKDTLILGL